MLKQLLHLLFLGMLCFASPQLSFATSHHSGHGGGTTAGGGSAGGAACEKISVKNVKPVALSELSSGDEFSMLVFGVKNPDDIEITIKEVPVEFTFTDREIFLAVKAKIPANLPTGAARVNIKIEGKSASCNETTGWLYKIK